LSIEEMYSGPKMKFLRPGELKGSYSDYDLLRMGFKKSQNGSWYIPQTKWDKLVNTQQIGEEDLAERYSKEFEGYSGNNPAIGKLKILTPRDIRGKYTDDQLITVGFKKEPNGNFTIPLLKWNKLRSTKKLEDNVSEDETMQYAAEKIAATNPYGGMKDRQYRGSVSEASGYIPSEKEKNDPRFKTALTVDVKPDAVKKNAKAFSWLTNRAGVPPQARPDGKVK